MCCDSVASFIVDAGYSPEVAKQQLRHTDAHTTLNYIHLRGGITERAMADISNSLKLDADKGREASIFNSLLSVRRGLTTIAGLKEVSRVGTQGADRNV